jgi:hypothetical protein
MSLFDQLPQDLKIELGRKEHQLKLGLLHSEYLSKITHAFTHEINDTSKIACLLGRDAAYKVIIQWGRPHLLSMCSYHSIREAKQQLLYDYLWSVRCLKQQLKNIITVKGSADLIEALEKFERVNKNDA